ncbi:hypothetical protein OROGR_007810 [Orobanche gracilis]
MLRFLRYRIGAVRQVTKPPAGCRPRPLTRCLQQPQTSVRDTIHNLLGKGPKHAAGPTVARACSYAIDFTHAHQVWSRALSSSSSPRPGSPKDKDVTSSHELVNTSRNDENVDAAESFGMHENVDGRDTKRPRLMDGNYEPEPGWDSGSDRDGMFESEKMQEEEEVTLSQELANSNERMPFKVDKEEPKSSQNDENVDGAESFVPGSSMDEEVTSSQELVNTIERMLFETDKEEAESSRIDENVDGAELFGMHENIEGMGTKRPRSVNENYELESGSDSDSDQNVMSQSGEMHEEERPAEEELPQQEEGCAHVGLGEDQEREGVSVSENSGSGEAMGHGQDEEGYEPDGPDSTSSGTCSTCSVSGSASSDSGSTSSDAGSASSDSGSTSSDAGSTSSNQQTQFQVEQDQVNQQGMEAVVQEGEEVQQPLAYLDALSDSGTYLSGDDVSPTSVLDPPGSSDSTSSDSSDTDSDHADTDAYIDIM